MKNLLSYIIALVTTFGLSPLTAKVVDLDRSTDTVTIETSTGILYQFYGCEDYCMGDYVSAIVWRNGTEGVTDDVIISAHYAGYSDYAEQNEPLPDSFPHDADFAEDFHRDFPGECFKLYHSAEVTTGLLEDRIEWNEYLVEVTTGTVLNERLDGQADLPEPYNYISYRRVPFETKPGDRIVTYFVYEIHSDGEDDIIARYDYPLN